MVLAFIESRIKEEIFYEKFVNDISSYIDQIYIDEVSSMMESCNEQDVFFEKARKQNGAYRKVHSGVLGIVNKIITFIKGIFDKVKNTLTRKDISKDFKGSKTEKFYINYDANKKIKEVDALMTRGNKIIDSIRKGTPVSRASFNAFKLEAKDFCDKTPKLVKVSAAASAVAVTGIALWSHRSNILNSFGKITGVLNSCKDSVSAKMNSVSNNIGKGADFIKDKNKKDDTKNNTTANNKSNKTIKINVNKFVVHPNTEAYTYGLKDKEQVKQMAETLAVMSQLSSAFGRIAVGFTNLCDGIIGNKK